MTPPPHDTDPRGADPRGGTDPHRASAGLDEALDALPPEGGTAELEDEHGRTSIEVAEADRIGVRVRGLRHRPEQPHDVGQQAEELPGRLRGLGEELEAVEVDRTLGGAVLRTRPEEMRGGEFFEVGVRPDETEIRRYRVDEAGDRRTAEWTMTRDQLRRLVDDASGS